MRNTVIHSLMYIWVRRFLKWNQRVHHFFNSLSFPPLTFERIAYWSNKINTELDRYLNCARESDLAREGDHWWTVIRHGHPPLFPAPPRCSRHSLVVIKIDKINENLGYIYSKYFKKYSRFKCNNKWRLFFPKAIPISIHPDILWLV